MCWYAISKTRMVHLLYGCVLEMAWLKVREERSRILV